MAKPKFSVSEITTFHQTFDEDLASYAEAGVEGIGIWQFKLPENDDANEPREAQGQRAQGDDDDPGRRSRSIPSRSPGPTIPPSARRSCATRSGASRRSSPRWCSSSRARPPRAAIPDEARRVMVEGFRKAAKVAAEYGLTLGMEPLHRDDLRHLDDGLHDPPDDRPDRRDRRAQRAGPVRRLPPARHRQRARGHGQVRQPHLAVDPHLRLARGDPQRLRPGAPGRRDHRPRGHLRRARRRRRSQVGRPRDLLGRRLVQRAWTSRTRSGREPAPTCSRAPRPASTRRGRRGGRRPDAARGQGRARHRCRAPARHRPRDGAGARRRGRGRRGQRHRRHAGRGPGVRRGAARRRACAPASTPPTSPTAARSTR